MALLVAACMAATLGLAGCLGGGGGDDAEDTTTPLEGISNALSQLVEGDVTGKVGTEYATKWFTFTVNTMNTASEFAGHEAKEGNTLVVANITITNTFGEPQPFGTFDWIVDDDTLEHRIHPMAPLNSSMMPEDYTLNDGQSVTYDVVVEYPADLANPHFMYIEMDENERVFTTFKIPIR